MRLALPALAALLALAGASAAAPAHEPTRLFVTPDPLPPDTPIHVLLVGVPNAGNVTNATLKACLAHAGVARFCQLAQPMQVDAANGTVTGVSADGFPAGEQAGVNVTIHYRSGFTWAFPQGIRDPDRAYFFYTVATAPPGSAGGRIAAPGALAALVGLAGAAWGARRVR